MGALLAPHWPEVRHVVAWRLKTIAPQPTDVEEIAGKVFKRLADALSKKTRKPPLESILPQDTQCRRHFVRVSDGTRTPRPPGPQRPSDVLGCPKIPANR
jgi:hypothetical protein